MYLCQCQHLCTYMFYVTCKCVHVNGCIFDQVFAYICVQ